MKKYSVIIALAAIAIINAGYLSYEAYQLHFGSGTASTFCTLSSGLSCSGALSSPYALILGIPFPWIALVVYPVLLTIAWQGHKKSSYAHAKALAILSGLGICFNALVIYRETFLIHVYCPLCLLCTAIIISVFVLSLRLTSEGKQQQKETSGNEAAPNIGA